MQVAYLAQNLIDAHLARHALEDAGIPAFVFGENLLGGAGELPLFGVLRVCVPDGCEAPAKVALAAAGLGPDGGLQDAEAGPISLEDPGLQPG
jgi:hypothetical protein